uniref:Geo1 protein n=3 Tax=Geosmithia TaxID=241409 RepID=A0A090C676_9HYPO|nr:class II hydrophobin [Geosmithia sp. 21 MK-2014]CDK12886.1 class II hydrophobin [Geosmithia sp. 22 MK-2014]CDK12896.1 class II hydrophobin [Geosmithia langdonii]
MKSFAITAALFAAVAMASPLEVRTGDDGGSAPPYDACPSELLSNAECCDVDVAGLLSINCAPPDQPPTSAEDFKDLCAKRGQSATCCLLPVLGEAVACQAPAGSG